MNVSDAIRARKSVRAFLDRPVPRSTIETILDTARWAASGTNTQPWEVVVLQGEAKDRVCQRILDAFECGEKSRMDYHYYPVNWKDPYKSRRFECGMALYRALDIRREDTERRKSQWVANYRAFDAPAMLLYFMDRELESGSFMDFGQFLQSVMLAALDHGLATCPQAALAEYPDVVRETLGIGEDKLMLCGTALGYEDADAAVNNYRTDREPVSAFTRFLDRI